MSTSPKLEQTQDGGKTKVRHHGATNEVAVSVAKTELEWL
jgi:hypothetical protein